ncbi:ABC transporter substrate-binding protein [Actinomadura luteofluorescens]|uniref:ABC transporter substrate-binding protein n=1 Tax=Actinomadura luteofluorescens TaxID=46163 RepID=UPI002164ADDC|nr:ABC transporter substrate-binding protein [Actinomadura glauciflava]MCR3745037.1 ABC-type branched-chain amino acid transport system, substrate-binding protein [Actinomadura glauciflava]
MSRRHAAVAATAAVVVMASGCGGTGAGGSDGPIKIGASFDLSGPAGFFGKTGRDGAVLAVEKVNRDGGVNGRRLALESRDDKCDTATAVANVRRFAGDRDVAALTGFTCSPAALAAKPLVDQAKLPMMVSQATASEIHTPAGRYTWMSNVPADYEAAGLTKAVVENLKPSRLAVVHVGNPYGKASADGVEAWLDQNGRRDILVGRIEIPMTASNYSVQMSKLKALDADVTLAVVYDLPPLLQAAARAGVGTKFVSFNGGMLRETITSLAKAGMLKGFTSSAMWPVLIAGDSRSPQMAEFANAFKKKYGNWPDNGNLQGYAGVMLLAEAMRRGGVEVSRESVQKAIAEKMTRVDLGLYFPYSFSRGQHGGARTVTVLTYRDNTVPGENGLYGSATLSGESQ